MSLTNPNKLINVQELDYFKQKADTVFATKSELSTLEQKLEGPYYDAEHRCIVYPDYETTFYDADSRGIIV